MQKLSLEQNISNLVVTRGTKGSVLYNKKDKKFNFLYEDEKNCHFMDQTNFEQIQISKSLLGGKNKLLKATIYLTTPVQK